NKAINAQFELTFNVTECDKALLCDFKYNRNLFDATTIELLADSLLLLIDGIIDTPQLSLSQLPLLSVEQYNYLLVDLNRTQQSYAVDICVHQMFEAQVAKNPHHIAVVADDGELTYAELNNRANQLAYYLIEQGVVVDTLVGLCMDRSLDMMIGLLAILKAGGAYVPLDSNYPPQRLAYMIKDSGINMVLTQKKQRGLLSDDIITIFVDDDKFTTSLTYYRITNPQLENLNTRHLAYVIYTSGSTGEPKGVMVEHHSLLNLCHWHIDAYDVTEQKCATHLASIGFDAAVWEIWPYLLSSAKIVMISDETRLLPSALFNCFVEQQVTHCFLPTALLEASIKQLNTQKDMHLEYVLTGGEKLSAISLDHAQLVNHYGPTEAAVVSSCYHLSENNKRKPPIGQPISNTQLYVLDGDQQLMPFGSVGELYIGGAGLARGYLNRAELTAERFIQVSLGGEMKRLYRTGDVVRYLDDGNLVFIGRVDDQVKIRGFRIELGEIEQQISSVDDVQTCCVIATQPDLGSQQLVAYITQDTSDTVNSDVDIVAEIRTHLHSVLPDYMIPAQFMLLQTLPLTANGKVDHKALPAVDFDQSIYVAPKNSTEHTLCEMWSQLLQLPVEKISTSTGFFELGGHSLLSIRLVTAIQEAFQVKLSIKSIFEFPQIDALAEIIDASDETATTTIAALDRDSTELLASFAQQRLWFIDRMESGSSDYNICAAMDVEGTFNIDVAEQAFIQVIHRHEPLRTVFADGEKGIIQIIREQFAFTIEVLDFSSMPLTQQQDKIQTIVQADADTPFDLENDLMLRVSYITVSQHKGVLLFNLHHIAADGWSMSVLIDEFASYYQTLLNKQSLDLAPLAIQYADYAQWQRDFLTGEVLARQLHYWTQQLADLPVTHSLPLDRARPLYQTGHGAKYAFTIEPSRLQGLKHLALEQQSTLFMVLHAAFACLISRYSSTYDVAIGTPVANRLRKELEPLIGFFVNTLVLRSQGSASMSFEDFLQQIKWVNLDAQAHQDLPFEHLVDQLNPTRSTRHNALFQIMFSMNTNETAELKLPNVEFRTDSHYEQNKAINAQFELTLNIIESEDVLQCGFEYNSDVFDASTIEGLAVSLLILIDGIVDTPELSLSQLPLLSARQQNYLLEELNVIEHNELPETCIQQLFEKQVVKSPDDIAVVFAEESLTYNELNIRANQLAHYLIEQKIVPDEVVGLCVDRSLDMIVGLLAILKAGAAYLPLDPLYPAQRLEHMITDGKATMIVTEEAHQSLLNGVTTVCIDDSDTHKLLMEYSVDDPQIKTFNPNHLAYVIYTSGSTGLPKGVMIEHRSISQHLLTMIDALSFNANDVFLQMASMNFDTFAEQTFSALIVGARLHLTGQQIWSREEFYHYCNKQHITVTDLSPSYLMVLLKNDAQNFWHHTSLSKVVVGGESLPQGLIKRWFSLSIDKHCQLFNAYGPTEATITCTVKAIKSSEFDASIGRPLPGRQLIIADEQLNLTPYGSVGELYIGGNGLARGYLNHPKMTLERFVINPFNNNQLDRGLYRTGDLVRYLKDGSIAFIGRVDNQVKIRGFRIELGEIEQQLSLHDTIENCAVTLLEDENGNKRLVAYLTDNEQTPDSVIIKAVRSHLQTVLPDYMIPNQFVRLESLPLMPNGKINRQALPYPSAHCQDQNTYIAPHGEIELTLCKIWSQLLKRPTDSISADANFFTLGGDSILSIQVVSRALEAGLKVTIKHIFEHQNIRALAPHVVSNKVEISQEPVVGMMDLLPIQHNFFTDETDLHHYNQAILLKAPTDFTPVLLTRFVELLYQRHDALRLRFTYKEDQWQATHQLLNEQMLNDTVDKMTLETTSFESLEVQANVYQRSLSLQQGPLFKAIHCVNAEGETKVLLIIHHLLVDGVSWRILMDDFERLYQQHSNDQPLGLLPKSSSYQAWGEFLKNFSQDKLLLVETDYWQTLLSKPLETFTNKSPNNKQKLNFANVELKLDALITTQLLTDAQKAYNTQINELLLSALLMGFNQWSGHNSIRIDLEGHGRQELDENIDLSQTLGWFTTLYPLMLSSDTMDCKSVICAVKEQHRAVPNQGIGYGVLKYLTAVENLFHDDISPILFNYLGQFSKEEGDAKNFILVDESIGDLISPLRHHEHDLNFNGSVLEDRLSFTVSYNQNLYDEEEITQLLGQIKQALTDVVSHCLKPNSGCLTPTDFSLTNISQAQLNQWQIKYQIGDIYPATPMQQGLLFHSALDNSAYVSQLLFTLETGVNIEAFRKAWQKVLDRHDVLRTVFVTPQSGEIQQLVLNNVELDWTETDVESLDEKHQLQHIESERYSDKHLGFVVEKGPLIRLKVWHLGEGRYRVLLSDHHALTDGWSMPIIFTDVMEYYSAEINAEVLQKPPSTPYRSYVQWLGLQDKQKAIDFWQQELSGIEGPTLIAALRDAKQKGHLEYTLEINQELTEKLSKIVKESQVTMNSLLLACWSYIQSRYANHNTVVFGTTVSGRPAELHNIEGMIGLFINTIPVRIDVPADLPFKQWLEVIHAQQVERNEFSYLSLVEIQQLANCGRDAQLIDNLFVFENYPFDEQSVNSQQQKLSVSDFAGYEETDYTLMTTASFTDTLRLKFSAKRAYFSDQSLAHLARNFENILLSVIKDSQQTVQTLNLLSAEEIQKILHRMSITSTNPALKLTIHELFEKQVEKSPNNVALIFEENKLNYAELNIRINQLSHCLIEQGVNVGDIVGLCIERSLEMIISLMAIIKAGAAYLPLDPSYPQSRLDHMMIDSNLSIVITQKNLVDITEGKKRHQLILDDENSVQILNAYPQINPGVKGINSNDLAYIIYTSGSTGQPKGVLQKHGTIVNLVHGQASNKGLTQPMKTLQFSPISFDVSIQEIATCWFTGSPLFIIPQTVKDELNKLPEFIKNQGIERMFLPPIVLNWLAEEWIKKGEVIDDLKEIIVAGEALYVSEYLKSFLTQHQTCSLWNHYGPTETHVATSAMINITNEGVVPIGVAIPNLSTYILNSHMQLLPYGAIGELYIAGAGLAKGYLNQEELTANQFIEHTFCETSTQLLYKTGDLVRYLEDDQLGFIGRVDDQVKIRGFRIEPGEIEQQISSYPAITTSAVMVREDEPEQKYLCAYFVSHSELEDVALIADIKMVLHKHLPNYMVPSQFVRLSSMPLTKNGKIAYKQLPQPETFNTTVVYTQPQGETERGLAKIWAQLLKIPKKNISTDADFFALGGHSLLSVRLLAEIRSLFACELSIRDIFDTPQLSQLSQRIDNARVLVCQKITAIIRDDSVLPASYAQQRLWFIDQMDSGSIHYNLPSSIHIKGDFRLDIAEASFKQIIQRHETLRTTFVGSDKGPLQVINEHYDFKIKQIDLTRLSLEDQNKAVEQAINNDAKKAFNLGQDLMLRVSYLQLNDNEGVMVFCMHHIASDGWSIGVMVNEFVTLYSADLEGVANPLPPLAIQYTDYAEWQRQWLQGEVLEKQLDYWSQQLSGLPQVHNLPLDAERPTYQTFNGAIHHFHISSEILKLLEELALKNNATLFMVIHAAFSLLLSRYANNTDIVIGSPVANRTQKELAELIGFFVNTVVLRVDCDGDLSFEAFLKQVRNTNLDAQAHQDIAFEQLVDHLNPDRSTSYQALFQVMLSMNTNDDFTLSLPNVIINPFYNEETTAQVDLILNAVPTMGKKDEHKGLSCSFVYNTDLFLPKTIERFAKSMKILLGSITTNATQKIAQLSLLCDADINHLMYTLNDTQVDYPQELCTHQLFEQQVKIGPDDTAVFYEGQSLKYFELNVQANQLAHFLIEQGIKPDDCIGVCVERSLDMMIAVLAILKAGAAYLPLDPDYPQGRLEHMMQDSGLSYVVTQKHLVDISCGDSRKLLLLDDQDFINLLADYSQENPQVKILNSQHLAYIIYTSGSTGLPKGVMIEHHSANNLAIAQIAHLSVKKQSRVLHFASINFDAATSEWMMALLSGASLYICEKSIRKDLNKLADYLQGNRITHVTLPPAVLHYLDSTREYAFDSLLVAGEAFEEKLSHQWGAQYNFFNGYGPTEVTVCATMSSPIIKQRLNIGQPIANTCLYVLDDNQQILPYGSVGELYVGGVGLARGYLNQPALTAERFMQVSLNGDVQRLYRTGDVVRYLDDGSLVFIGRVDDQVKIRGFRIELGEIEQQLVKCPEIQSCLVVVSEAQRLTAYFTITTDVDDETLFIQNIRLSLKNHLPDYMIPSAFVLIEQFPLTANGKIDRKALPEPSDMSLARCYVKPNGSIEQTLVTIWSALLKIPQETISTEDNFFELGGHSLLITQMLHAITEQLTVQLPIKNVFQTPSIKQLAKLIDEESLPQNTITRQDILGPKPLSFAQYRVWFIEQLKDQTNEHNMTSAVVIKGVFDPKILESALNVMITQHDILRTHIEVINDKPHQVIHPVFVYDVPVKDLRVFSVDEQEKHVKELSYQHDTQVFKLDQLPLLSAVVIQTAADEYMLRFNHHHIISDGWSQQLFYTQLLRIYQSLYVGKEAEIETTKLHYSDYAHWQNTFLLSAQAQEQRSFWQKYLTGCKDRLHLPIEKNHNDFDADHNHFSICIAPQIRDQLKKLAQSYQGSLFHVLNSSFALLIARLSGETDFNIGIPVTGRHIYGTQDMLGMFLNNLPIRHQLDLAVPFSQLLQQQIVNVNAVLSNQDIPFENILEITGSERSIESTPLFQILFNMLNLPEDQINEMDLGFDMQVQSTAEIGNKFNMTLYLTEITAGIGIDCHYNSSLYDSQMIEQLLNQYHHLLSQIAENSESICAEYSLNTQPTIITHDLSLQSHCTDDVTTMFRHQVSLNPQAIAVIDADASWSYQDLFNASQSIARKLQKNNVGFGDVVTIMASRRVSVVIAIMAVLQTGAAYSIIVNDSPVYQIDQHLESVESSVLLLCQSNTVNTDNLVENLNYSIDVMLVKNNFASYTSSYYGESGSIVAYANQPQQAACITFSSGSSGVPKGVVGTHAGLSSYLQWWPEAFNITSDDRLSLLSGLSHDPLQRDIFGALCVGACVVIPSESDFADYRFNDWLKAQKISVMHLTPAMAEVMSIEGIEQTTSIKTIFLTGESLRADTVESLRLFNADLQLINCYGTTESQRALTYHRISHHQSLSIVTPIAINSPDTRLRLINAQGTPCGVGELGEIIIESKHLAQGYLNDIELTAEKFTLVDLGLRQYKTGDLGIYLDNERIHYYGRGDGQINIRGYRVELGEIEFHLAQSSQVNTAVVILNAQNMLVAFLSLSVKSEDHDQLIIEIKNALKLTLAQHMMPSAFVVLDEIPLNANGKIDRKSLHKIEVKVGAKYLPLHGDKQTKIGKIWSELLKTPIEKISRDANFFESGGHSLLLIHMLHALVEQLGVQLSIKSVFQAPTIEKIALLIEQEDSSQNKLVRQDKQGQKPLSYAQYRVWFIDQLKDHSNEHNMISAVKITGSFSANTLQAALNVMIDQHEILRTRIDVINDEPHQFVEDEYVYALPFEDLRGLNDSTQQKQAQQLSNQHDTQVFKLNQLPLFSALVIQIKDDEYLLHFNHHHIISDGWSQQVFYAQLMNIYQTLLNGNKSGILAAQFHYSDYAYWQQQFLQSKQAQEQRQFWKSYLNNSHDHLSLSIENKHHDFNAGQNHITIVVTSDIRDQLKLLAQLYQGSLFNVLHSSFALLISRLSGESDFNIGLPVTGRHIYGTQDMLGMFLNNVPIRHQLDLAKSYAQLLQQQITNVNNVLSNQDIPFEKILEIIGCERNIDSTPLFQILFNMMSFPQGDVGSLDLGFEIQSSETAEIENKFNMTMYLIESEEGIHINCHYNRTLYDQAIIEQLLNQYVYLLTQIAEDSGQPCAAYSLNILPNLINHDVTIKSYFAEDVTALFRQRVKSQPHAIAIIDGENQWSYQQLLDASYQKAIQLQGHDIGNGDVVTIMAARHVSVVIAILAVLQTGAAYSIVVPNSPIYQINQHINRVDSSLLLLCEADEDYSDALLMELNNALKVLEVSHRNSLYHADVSTFIAHDNQPQQIACITFTSGSSGTPKAIVGTHAGLSGYLQWWPDEFNISTNDRFSLLSGLSHDPLQRDIFSSLCNGASLVIPSEKDFANFKFVSWIKQQQISVMHLTPAMAEVITIEGIIPSESVKSILLTGEALRADITNGLRQFNSSVEIYNCYGASESQRAATYYRIPKDNTFALSPISVNSKDTRLRLVNEVGADCGVGELGEIIIESAHLACGYLNEEALNAQYFNNIADGLRSYRTGDLGIYLDQQSIRYLGRRDFQVNIRGYRVELGEIEYHISQLTQVLSSAVIVKQKDTLIGFVSVEKQNIDEEAFISEIKTYLTTKLPIHMVPSVFVLLDKMPLNANGKLDRKALHLTEVEHDVDYSPPEGKIAIGISHIWSELLKIPIEKISKEANFFELGGHSLLSMRLLSAIREQFNCELSVRTIFESPQLSALAEAISVAHSPVRPIITAITREVDQLVPSYAQQRLWFIDQMDGGSAHYNMSSAMRVKGAFRLDIAEQSFSQIIERHETLRTVFIDGENGLFQVITDRCGCKITHIDLSDLAESMQDQRIKQAIKQDAETPFNLCEDLMLRVSYLKLSVDEGVLLFNMHHIASDGWSMGILVNEFVQLYRANSEGLTNPLPPLTIQYADYAHWQRYWLQGEILETQLQYWDQKLADLPQVHSLPLDKERPKYQTFNGAMHQFNIKADVLAQLDVMAIETKTTLFMLVHAAFAIVLARYSNNNDIVIGTPVANRLQKELEKLIGFFVNTLVLRVEYSGDLSFKDFLGLVKNTNLDAQANQDVPFEHLVDRLNPE
ncbi:MAG: non-ribosomal peptide synthase/polyketide synthase, partial [Alcanivoracaceae bacterium]|nr:non-ribosomal peptide synthase/polyketide synthase [Alcanivoracaceae bacterium]